MVVLIAMPFGAASGRRNIFVGVVSSILICFVFFVLQQLGLALGTGGRLAPWLAAWGELRGRALAAALRVVLRERFDEDWWRNPRSLAALQGLWSRGGRPTAAELWAEIPAAPSLEALSRELAHACE